MLLTFLWLACGDPTCGSLDDEACAKTEGCWLAEARDPCDPDFGSVYTGCINENPYDSCPWTWREYRTVGDRCLAYDGMCTPGGLEACQPECIADTAPPTR